MIRRVIAFWLSTICLLPDGFPGLWPCFAGLNAFVPLVIKVCVTCTSAVFEPRTTASATTSFARFLDYAAFGAYGAGDRRADTWCLHVDIGQHDKGGNALIVKSRCLICVSMYAHFITRELTFANLHARRPPVTNFSVACTSAVLKPSTARSTTTDSARFLEHAAPWACHRISDGRGDNYNRRADYQLSIFSRYLTRCP